MPGFTETRYYADFQEFGNEDVWFVAGDKYGYADRRDAEKALNTRARQAQVSRMFKPMTAARIRTVVTTSTVAPYILI